MNPFLKSLFKVNKKTVKEDKGIIYLLEIMIEGDKYIKIGVTTRDIETRMCELALSVWKQYRYMPYIYSKRYRKTTGIYQKEAQLLELLKEYRAEPDKIVQGHTEMHKLELNHAVNMYEKVLEGIIPVVTEVSYCTVCGKKEIFDYIQEDKIIKVCGNSCKIKKNN